MSEKETVLREQNAFVLGIRHTTKKKCKTPDRCAHVCFPLPEPETEVRILPKHGTPIRLALVDGRVKFAYKDLPPTVDLLHAIEEADPNGQCLIDDFLVICEGVARLRRP